MNKTGVLGEQIAADYLKKKGYKIIDRNYRIRGGEIDLIATFKGKLIFVEVKTRSSNAFGLPEESVGRFKISFIERASQFYLLERPNLPQDLQIDVVSVELFEGLGPQIRHHQSVTS